MHKYQHQSGLIFTNLVDFDMVYGHRRNVDLGTRESFADYGQTIADLLDAGPLRHGQSFKKDIIDECL